MSWSSVITMQAGGGWRRDSDGPRSWVVVEGLRGVAEFAFDALAELGAKAEERLPDRVLGSLQTGGDGVDRVIVRVFQFSSIRML